MHTRLYKGERLRINTDKKEDTFVDIKAIEFESLAVTFYPRFGYLEIREKECELRIFQFLKKSYLTEFDFGWWADAEIICSYEDGKIQSNSLNLIKTKKD